LSVRIIKSSKFIKSDVNKNILKTEILSISVTSVRFPQVVRVPPRSSEKPMLLRLLVAKKDCSSVTRRKKDCSCGYSSQKNCSQFVRSLRSHTWTHFPRRSRRPSLQSNKFNGIHFKYSFKIHQ